MGDGAQAARKAGAARIARAELVLDLYDLVHMAQHGNGPLTIETLARIKGCDHEAACEAFVRIRRWLMARGIRFGSWQVEGEPVARIVFDRGAVFGLVEDELEWASQVLTEAELARKHRKRRTRNKRRTRSERTKAQVGA
jgi:hypothetical protein